MNKYKLGFTLFFIFIFIWILPNKPLDPWNLIVPKKFVIIFFILTFIQILGSLAIFYFGPKRGAIFSGFFSGLISSTATTASLARQSKQSPQNIPSIEWITFLSATLAMLTQCILLIFFVMDQVYYSYFILFIGPILSIFIMFYITTSKAQTSFQQVNYPQFNVVSTLILSLFILVILIASKLLQIYFGDRGLFILTFLVSLFEVHGSFIANIQLYNVENLNPKFIGNLFSISIIASTFSKLILIYILGSRILFLKALKANFYFWISILFSWILFTLYT